MMPMREGGDGAACARGETDQMDVEFRNMAPAGTERSKLLCRLDARESGRDSQRREHRRWNYRATEIAIIVQHPGGGLGRFMVCARNLSAGGMSFIHGGYLHPGSDCRILLEHLDGRRTAQAAVVRHCRHIEARYHEIGVQFAATLDPGQVVDREQLEDQSQVEETPLLQGDVLLVDASPADRRLLEHYLVSTGLKINAVDTPGRALDALRRNLFSVVLCDLKAENYNVPRMIEQMRALNYHDPILVLTAESNAQMLSAARQAGANEIIGKPCSFDALVEVLAEWLQQPRTTDPIRSDFEDRPGMAELLVDYIEQTQVTMAHLERALQDADSSTARDICVGLEGSGGGYGFHGVTAAARDALKAIDAEDELSNAAGQIQRLINLCCRLRCTNTVRPIRPYRIGTEAA